MTPFAETGRRGEQAAVDYLRREGFVICARNWRYGRYEIDVVARRSGYIHFVEVKTRRADSLTAPEAALTHGKAAALRRAAARYLALYAPDLEPRFDLLAVAVYPDGCMEIRRVEDAVEYNW